MKLKKMVYLVSKVVLYSLEIINLIFISNLSILNYKKYETSTNLFLKVLSPVGALFEVIWIFVHAPSVSLRVLTSSIYLS